MSVRSTVRVVVLLCGVLLGCDDMGSVEDGRVASARVLSDSTSDAVTVPEPTRALREITTVPSAPCFALDSLALAPLVFADMSADDETGDIGGLEIRFLRGPRGGLGAMLREASGGLPAPQPVDSLAYDGARDSLTIWWSELENGYVYRLKPACDYLMGVGTFWITSTNPTGHRVNIVLPRTLTPMPDRR